MRLKQQVEHLFLPQAPGLAFSLFVKFYVLLTAMTIGIGAVFLAGREHRFADPAFQSAGTLVDWVPFLPAWACWGLMFVAFGVTKVIAMGRPLAIHVLRYGVVTYGFLGIAFIWAAMDTDSVSWVWAVVFGGMAVAHLIMSDHLDRWGWRG